MLKGLALTPPVLGRISIGHMVEKDGKRVPQRDDEFTITTQIQGRDGWIAHPLDEEIRAQAGGKLRSIPVRMVFNDPDLNLRAHYTRFDRNTGRPTCVGNGETCRRVTSDGIQQLPCPAPDACEFSGPGECKPFGRLNVQIGDEDGLGTFIFRTTGFNSIRTLATRLRYFAAVSGELLAGLPLELRLRGKSTQQSYWTPVYFVDLTARAASGLCGAIASARSCHEERVAAGFDQQALDEAARQGFLNGAFEESAEEAGAVVEEFYPAGEDLRGTAQTASPSSLAEKLSAKSAGKSARSRAAARSY